MMINGFKFQKKFYFRFQNEENNASIKSTL